MIDFNVDTGEGVGNEEKLLSFVSSCNIACGGHAGSVEEIRRVVLLAKKFGVKIGAHPSYPDTENFGRQKMIISQNDLLDSIHQQISLLATICVETKSTLNHIKAHGALYHELNSNRELAEAYVSSIKIKYPKVVIVGYPRGELQKQCLLNDVEFLAEGFADRSYTDKGLLVSRSSENAVLSNDEKVVEQVKFLSQGQVKTLEGDIIPCAVDTICFHGDHYGAEKRIQYVYDKFRTS